MIERLHQETAALSHDSRLARTRHDRLIAGVMGGIARRFGWNATVLRIAFVLLSVVSAAFPGILVYGVLWWLMPLDND
ncbi:PspC domain-containing protein [Lysobacter pythonis]|uniref:PspC domain-containing protein n=1 Tax=Solilutibacter pythonis TaxID=2483112 RepID=A0A3M2I259_9GAMM|nr:PspC domain-containing protein [Lysobacter pythonis]RMH94485.1 PspC domain-containing protein [Lysobacter pythonis]